MTPFWRLAESDRAVQDIAQKALSDYREVVQELGYDAFLALLAGGVWSSWVYNHPPINDALGGGGSPIALVHFRCVMHGSDFVLCVDFCLPSRRIFVCLVVGCLSV